MNIHRDQSLDDIHYAIKASDLLCKHLDNAYTSKAFGQRMLDADLRAAYAEFDRLSVMMTRLRALVIEPQSNDAAADFITRRVARNLGEDAGSAA